MRFTLFFLALLGALAAQPVSPEEAARLDRETKDRFDQAAESLFRDADSIVIRTQLPPIEGAADMVTISNQEVVQSLAKKVKAAKFQGPWFRAEDGTVISRNSGPCQCWGEFEFQFFSKKNYLGTLSIHHWSHVRSEILTGGSDVKLEPQLMKDLYETACDALPVFGARLKDLDPTRFDSQ